MTEMTHKEHQEHTKKLLKDEATRNAGVSQQVLNARLINERATLIYVLREIDTFYEKDKEYLLDDEQIYHEERNAFNHQYHNFTYITTSRSDDIRTTTTKIQAEELLVNIEKQYSIDPDTSKKVANMALQLLAMEPNTPGVRIFCHSEMAKPLNQFLNPNSHIIYTKKERQQQFRTWQKDIRLWGSIETDRAEEDYQSLIGMDDMIHLHSEKNEQEWIDAAVLLLDFELEREQSSVVLRLCYQDALNKALQILEDDYTERLVPRKVLKQKIQAALTPQEDQK